MLKRRVSNLELRGFRLLVSCQRTAATRMAKQVAYNAGPTFDVQIAGSQIAMRELYAWVPWFSELAQTIADGDPRELADRASKIEWRPNDNSSPLLDYGEENIDPFSFIYTLATHCGGAQGRTRVMRSATSLFGLEHELPLTVDDAFYFPQGTPQNTLFHQRGQGNPELLWDLLRYALKGPDAVPEQVFSDALQIGMVGVAKLTQTMFLINARAFLPYDQSTRRLLPGAAPAKPDWNRYLAAIDELREQFPGCEPYEINLFAYLTFAKKLPVGQGVFQVSSNVHGDNRDLWDDFDQNCSVYTGGQAPGIPFDHDAGGPFPNAYPLSAPDQGDLILARYGGEGRGIGIVWRNDYRQELSPEARLHVLWLNKRRAQLGFSQQRGFSRAQRVEQAFRRCDEYVPTFAVVDQLSNADGRAKASDGLTKSAVLATLAEYDRLGRARFLQQYGYEPARKRWIRHGDNQYDMKAIWRAAFGHMEGGRALTRDDERYLTRGNQVRRNLENLGFSIVRSADAAVEPVVTQPLNQILYGPPGTGKTWRTVNLALAIVDGQPDSGHDLGRFDQLRFNPKECSGNIAMVTFHQNFAYEDFVEGIRPNLSNEWGGVAVRTARRPVQADRSRRTRPPRKSGLC